ncbi:unnamed protein product [marine sediment metagenome]|uniref:Uncharacterized protein n=1 Tax=marine sediment metagenome TaxID=412755 RepID=X0YVB3_9ZZZZ
MDALLKKYAERIDKMWFYVQRPQGETLDTYLSYGKEILREFLFEYIELREERRGE